MKKVGLLMALAAILSTALDAAAYHPQQKDKTTKAQTAKPAKKPMKKVMIKTVPKKEPNNTVKK